MSTPLRSADEIVGVVDATLAHRAEDPLDFQLLFESSPEVLLVLLPDAPRFTMVAATESRLAATLLTATT